MSEATTSSDPVTIEDASPTDAASSGHTGEDRGDTPPSWQPTVTVESAGHPWTLLIAALGGIAVLVVTGGILATRLPGGTTLAGTTVASADQAPDALSAAQARLDALPIRFTTAVGTEQTITGADLGLRIDRDLSTGPIQPGFPSIGAWLRRIPDGPVEVPFVTEALPPQTLTTVAEDVSRDPRNTDVDVSPARIEVVDGADGVQSGPGQVDAALAEALASIAATDPDAWPSTLEVTVDGDVIPPAVTPADVDALTGRLEELEEAEVGLVARTPVVTTEDDEDPVSVDGRESTTVTLTPRELRSLIDVEVDESAPDGDRLRLVTAEGVTPPRLVALMDLARIQPSLQAQVVNRSATPEQGDDLTDVSGITGDVVVQDRGAGFEPDRDATMTAIVEAAIAGGGEVEVVGDEGFEAEPADLGIREPISTFTTFYTAGQSRVQNIVRIAEIVDGTIIPAGETYELNHAVGRRTRDNGFTDGGAILDGQLVSDVGGGVSQFATTFFNAAWFAGVDLVDWKAHSFYFSRYPAGREATINFPNVNLEIRNDTPHAILVDTDTDATSVTVTFWSTPYYEVETFTGPCGCGGSFRITVDREKTAPGGQPIRESWTTLYRAQP